MGLLKGKTSIKIFKSYQGLRQKPYWGNHFWSRGYCVSTVGMDEEKILKYEVLSKIREVKDFH
jgi:putative transposase